MWLDVYQYFDLVISVLHSNWGKHHVQAFFKIASHASKFFCQIKHLIWFLSYSLIFVLFWLYCLSSFWCFWIILCIIFCFGFHVHHHITVILVLSETSWPKKRFYDNLTNDVMRGEYHRWILRTISKRQRYKCNDKWNKYEMQTKTMSSQCYPLCCLFMFVSKLKTKLVFLVTMVPFVIDHDNNNINAMYIIQQNL